MSSKRGGSKKRASKKYSVYLGDGTPPSHPLPPPPPPIRIPIEEVKLRVENILGQKLEMSAPMNSTIRSVKQALASLHGINVEKQALIRCGGGGRTGGEFVQLEDHKTLREYGVVENDRLMLVPVVRSGPLSDTSKSDIRVFFEEQDYRVGQTIDRLLKECGKSRRPRYNYLLAVMDASKPGDYTIMEYPTCSSSRSITESSEQSDQSKCVVVSQRLLSDSEREQNTSTHDKVKKLRADMQRRRGKKKATTSAVAKTSAPCGACGEHTCNPGCIRCERVFCPIHVKAHDCPKTNPGCRQQ